MHGSLGQTGRSIRLVPVASLVLVAFAVIVSLVPGMATWLQFDRLAVAHGEVWRLFTSHFVHWSKEHLFWDALALGALGWMCEREGFSRFLATVAAATLAIPLTLSFAQPQMTTYRGLSGIDSALFALLAANIARPAIAERNWRRLGMAIFISIGFAAKIGFEVSTGGTVFVNSAAAAMTPVPLAHIVGAFIGLLFGLMPAPLARALMTRECEQSEPPDLFCSGGIGCTLRHGAFDRLTDEQGRASLKSRASPSI
jgi:rhomboid family GlyGly-CTERM serine protease